MSSFLLQCTRCRHWAIRLLNVPFPYTSTCVEVARVLAKAYNDLVRSEDQEIREGQSRLEHNGAKELFS